MKLRAGENIRIVEEGEDTFIHAPAANRMTIKHGKFIVSGTAVEFLADEHIVLKTIHPDKLVMSVNIDREKARIADLETRVMNMEKVIVSLLKKESDEPQPQS